MIAWTQQYKIISNVFNSFQSGEKKNEEHPFTHKELERNQIFLSPEKYQNYTLGNFKILVIYNMWKHNFSSKIHFLKKLNSLNKKDILEFRQFKSDVLSFKYILEKDKNALETISLNPYEAYQQNLIHILTLGVLEFDDSDLGIIGKRVVKNARVLVSFFNLSKD